MMKYLLLLASAALARHQHRCQFTGIAGLPEIHELENLCGLPTDQRTSL